MKATTTMTFGCDLGDRKTHVVGIDDAGEVLVEKRIPTTAEGFQKLFAKQPRCRIVLEVGTHSPWVHELLAGLEHEVFVANPRMLKLISHGNSKSDSVDALLLARLGRADPQLLSPIVHRGTEARQDLAVIRSRALLVELRTAAISRVRSTVKSFGGRLPKADTRAFATKVRDLSPDTLRAALEPVLKIIEELCKQIATLEESIEGAVSARHPEAERLEQVTGVGRLTALSYVLTLEDPKRFRRSRQVGAYLGLRPRRAQSGNMDPQLRITKTGDVYVRKLMITSAHYILGPHGPDCDLRRWGLALATRGGKNGKKRALVAVARKLSVLLHRLWVSGAVYEPLRHSALAA